MDIPKGYHSDPPQDYAEKLAYIEVTRVPVDGEWLDSNERTLFCGSCNGWTKHVQLTDGWMCVTSGDYTENTTVDEWIEILDERIENDMNAFITPCPPDISARLHELNTKMLAGEIDKDEYNRQFAELQKKIDEERISSEIAAPIP